MDTHVASHRRPTPDAGRSSSATHCVTLKFKKRNTSSAIAQKTVSNS